MTPPEDDTLAPPSRGEGRLPEPEFDPFAEGDELSRSLLDDAEAREIQQRYGGSLDALLGHLRAGAAGGERSGAAGGEAR